MRGAYGKGGNLEGWNKWVEQADPTYGKRLFALLKKEGVVPEKLDDFRFLSVSANGGSREIGFAEALDGTIENLQMKPKKRPLVIASDIARVGTLVPEYANVDYVRLKADAHNLALPMEAVDVIYDRMGAVWYKVDEKLGVATLVNGVLPDWELEDIWEALKETFIQYRDKLKNHGSILLDDPDRISDNPMSTLQYLKKIIPDVDGFLKLLGLVGRHIGEEKDRLLAITRI